MNKILHLDDQKSFLGKFSTSFGSHFSITSEANSIVLDKHLENGRFDGFVIDIHMPYLDGAEAIKKIKSDPNHKDASIFIYTGDSNLDIRLDYIREGVTDFFTKDMNEEEILLRLKNGLNLVRNNAKSNKKVGNLTLNTFYLDVNVAGENIPVTLIEYKILLYLTRNMTVIHCRNDVSQFVWAGAKVDKNVLNTHLCNLRSKLQDWTHQIESVRLKGIRIKEYLK